MSESTLTSQRIYDGRVVHLDVDQVALAKGGQSVREVVRHPGAVMVVPVTADGRVVLVRQYRYAAGEALLELPAGTLDHPGEDPLACAQRELAEETGYQATQWRLLASFYTAPGFCTELIHCFLASDVTPGAVAEADADEDIELVMMPLSSAKTLARRGELRDAKTICGLLLAPFDDR
ncbi:MAG: NUDIX hydrolase [Fimbriimonadaceae bacterium]|nr:NUDIX hydrolase [Fimbriimonadaceae bacterium]